MNNIFNFTRFGKLFLKHTTEHFRSYLMSALVLCGIMTIFYAFVLITGGRLSPGLRCSTLAIFYLLGGSIFTSTVFSAYGDKNKAISSLTLPASHLEKFLIGWVYSYLLYSTVFTVCFWSIDSCFMQFASALENRKNLLDVMPDKFLMTMFSLYSIVHSVVIFGAVYFKNMHFVKTALYFFAAAAFLCLFHYSFMETLIASELVRFNPPFINSLGVSDSQMYYLIQLDESEARVYTGILLVGFTMVLWIASFFEIKEKQI